MHPVLVISRRPRESIVIGDDIVLTVVEVRGERVRLGVAAPKDVSVHRREVWELLSRPPSWAALDPAWLTWNDGAVPRLARAIAEAGDSAVLPVLADALEEAGCDDPDILGHCRAGGRDARTSWVVRLILQAS